MVSSVGASAVFAGRFRDNAARSLLLPRRRPGARTPLWQLRRRAADLLAVASRYGEFPVLLETYRECLRDTFDLPALTALLGDVAARRVRVTEVDLEYPSPFAAGLVYAYVAAFMYEGDAPLAERRAQALTLDRRMLAELVGEGELRDLIDPDVLAGLEDELQALAESRQATSIEGVADLLRRLGDLSLDELEPRCAEGVAGAAGPALVAERRAALVRVAGEERLIAAEDAGRYRDGLGAVAPPGLPAAFLVPVSDALMQLVRRWARTHGPFVAAEPAARFGVEPAVVAGVLAGLRDDGRLTQGAFRPGGCGAGEWCDVDVLRSLRQRSLAALRREVEPAEAEALAELLPAWQGVARVGATPAAGGLDRLYEVIGQLQGLPIPASVLERDVLPARVRDYQPRLLDELLAAGEVMWVGAGSIGRDDGRVVLALRSHAGLLLPRLGTFPAPGAAGASAAGAGAAGASAAGAGRACGAHHHLRQVLETRGACFFRELGRSGITDAELLDALWDLVWAGEVTGDAFAAVRAATGSGAQRGGRRGGPRSAHGGRPYPRPGSLRLAAPPRGQGRWSLVSRETSAGAATISPTEVGVAIAGQLLERYGVLTRDAVRGEGVPGGFAGVYPLLKAMEEAGRIRRGYFVAGMGGAQFALPGAVDRLRSLRSPAPGGPAAAVTVLAATDPANAYGLSLPWPVKGPTRVAGAYVVRVG
ncbi:MAG TPA: DEAD/DEAH box helicase, partial [Candidatus Dormibacteraeota bacterium]|nr:DEAD/DEAH box helicase [Candidatus Dormibacteraeota bacterium]